jgi:selenocysteine lyase/cysteine desulfurase
VNWERTRSFFPVTKHFAYLNHAGVAPISTRVDEAMRRYLAHASERGAFDYAEVYDTEIERARGRAAQLLGATRDEIAFVKNTTEGLGLVATGLDWRPGDVVLSCDLEYPSNVYPWWALRSRGVETRLLRGRDGALPLETVADALASPRVRLLSLSSVEFGSGARNDLDALGRLCQERGVLFCVDAIQSLGALPIDVAKSGIDFLAADGHKWLLGPEGCGIFYCAKRVLDRVQPRIVGWRSVARDHDFDTYQTELKANAGRFEEGTPNTAGIFGLGAAIDLALELGIDAIALRVLELSKSLANSLAAHGARLLSPQSDPLRSGIVSFRWRDEEPARTAARLRVQGVFVVARRGGVRASPHYYNHDSDLERLLSALGG